MDLLEHQQIADPFYEDKYLKLKWVSECKVKYSKRFSVDKEHINIDTAIELVFHGIDTYADITLNGQKLISTENAFRRYVVRVENLVSEMNELEIIINPTKKFDSEKQQKNPMPYEYAQTRKACYQYSWDWAPYLNTMGIWKDVELRIFNEIRLDYVWVRNKEISQ